MSAPLIAYSGFTLEKYIRFRLIGGIGDEIHEEEVKITDGEGCEAAFQVRESFEGGEAGKPEFKVLLNDHQDDENDEDQGIVPIQCQVFGNDAYYVGMMMSNDLSDLQTG